MWVRVQADVHHCLSVEVRGQLLGVGSLFLLWVLETELKVVRCGGKLFYSTEPSDQALLVRWLALLGLARQFNHLESAANRVEGEAFYPPDIQVGMRAAGRTFRLHQVICFTAGS